MKKNEKGITLLSLVVTVIVLSILASILVNVSIVGNPLLKEVNGARNDYNEQKEQIETKINSMTNGWENIIN